MIATAEMVADDHHGLHRRSLRFLQGLFENVGNTDKAAADTIGSASVHDLAHVVSIRDPARRDAGPDLRSTFAAEIGEFDLHRPGCEHSGLDVFEPVPNEPVIGLGGHGENYTRIIVTHRHGSFPGQPWSPVNRCSFKSRVSLVAMLAPPTRAWSALFEAQVRQDPNNALLHGHSPLFASEAEGFEYVPEPNVSAVPQPFADGRFPRID